MIGQLILEFWSINQTFQIPQILLTQHGAVWISDIVPIHFQFALSLRYKDAGEIQLLISNYLRNWTLNKNGLIFPVNLPQKKINLLFYVKILN